MILFCPACGDELEGFDPTYSREWPTHCGEVMVRLREDDPPETGFNRAHLPPDVRKQHELLDDQRQAPIQQPVEHLPSDDPGVMVLTRIADQLNAMIDSRVTRPTEAIDLQQLSREMERSDG